MQLVDASIQRPYLIWNYGGKTYATNKVICRPSVLLRGEERKFWKSCIKPSPKGRMTKYNRGTQVCRMKELFFSYKVMEHYHKNLKVSVRFKPFSKSLVDAIV